MWTALVARASEWYRKNSGAVGPQGLPACPFCYKWDEFTIGQATYRQHPYWGDLVTHTVMCGGCGVRMIAHRSAGRKNWKWTMGGGL